MLKWNKFFRVGSILWFEHMVDTHVSGHGACQRWVPTAMFKYSFSCSSFVLNVVFPCRTKRRVTPLIELLWSCFAEVVQVT